MSIDALHNDVITVMSAVITGGFVLIFVELGNRKNLEKARFREIMLPFMTKFSAMCRYMAWCVSHIHYPLYSKKTEHEEKFYEQTHNVARYGGRLIMSGDNYRVYDFSPEELRKACKRINDIWYQYGKMDKKRITWSDSAVCSQEYIRKELAIVNPQWLEKKEGVEQIVEVSGDFYADIYRPIAEESYRHRALMMILKGHTCFVLVSLLFVLISLVVIMFEPLSEIQLRGLTIIVLVLFSLSLLMIFVDNDKHLSILIWLRRIMRKIKPQRKRKNKNN